MQGDDGNFSGNVNAENIEARGALKANRMLQPIALVSAAGVVTLIASGAGSPEGVLTANVGSLYQRTDGGAATSLYVKESGSGNTGWVGK